MGGVACWDAEKYLQEAWPVVKGALKEFGVSCELNLVCDEWLGLFGLWSVLK